MKKLFSLIALAGVFAACQPEEIVTTFEEVNAKAEITVIAYDIASGNEVTSETTFTISNLPTGIDCQRQGDTFILEGNPTLDLSKQATMIEAKWTVGESQSQSIPMIKVIPGNVVKSTLTFLVGVKQVDPETSFYLSDPRDVSEKVEKFYLNNAHYAPISHDGGTWYQNPTEFIATGEVAYKSVEGFAVKSVVASDSKYSNAVATLGSSIKSNEFYEEKDCVLPIKVSAFAMYTAWQETCTKVQEIDIMAQLYGGDVKAGTITVEVVSYTSAQYEEKACPGHESHYVHGHGHDGHGAYNNAGGGIAYGD